MANKIKSDATIDIYDIECSALFTEWCKETNTELTVEALEKFQHDRVSSSQWQEFLKQDWDYKIRALKLGGNDCNFKNLPRVRIPDLSTEHMQTPIELEQCKISSIGDPSAIPRVMRYKCNSCKTQFDPVSDVSGRPPKLKCCDSQVLIPNPQPGDLEDIQWIRLQELERDSTHSKIPLSLHTLMRGKSMIWSVGFTDTIKPKGQLKYRQVKTKDGGLELRKWFDMFSFEKTSTSEDVEVIVTPEDIKWIKEEQKKPGFFERLIDSFCPWIHGEQVMKEMVLLGLISMKTNTPLRILIIGDPSTGKSDVLKAANMLPTSKHYSVMKNDRGTGLTVSAVKDPDTDQWTVEGGGFARAHGWCLIIDEFQAGREEDIDGLNSVIWDHEIPYNLVGGLNGKFNANCALIIACNPADGVLAKEENIHRLLKFVGEKTLPAFITRMSFILLLEDRKTPEQEEKVGGSIFDNIDEETKLNTYSNDWYRGDPILLQTDTMALLDLEPVKYYRESQYRYGINTLRKMVKYITENIKLESMPKHLRQDFIDYYVSKRTNVAERSNKIISPRYMTHLLDIARNRGRWHGRTQPNEEDMEYAFDRMMTHMTIAATDPKTGELDTGSVNGNMTESRMKELELEQVSKRGRDYQWEWACEKAMALHEDGYFMRDELVHFLKMIPRAGWQHRSIDINKRIESYITLGSMKTNNNGRFKWQPTGSM